MLASLLQPSSPPLIHDTVSSLLLLLRSCPCPSPPLHLPSCHHAASACIVTAFWLNRCSSSSLQHLISGFCGSLTSGKAVAASPLSRPQRAAACSVLATFMQSAPPPPPPLSPAAPPPSHPLVTPISFRDVLSSQTLCRHTRPPQPTAAAHSTPPRIILLETNDDLSDAAAALTRKVNQEHCSRFVMLARAVAAAVRDDDDDDGDDNHHDECHSNDSGAFCNFMPHTLLLCTCVASAADDITSAADAAPPHPLPPPPSAASALSAMARACRARLKAGDRVPPYERGCLLLLMTALQSGVDIGGDGGSNRLQLLLACAALSNDACVPAIRLLQPTLSSPPLLHLISPPSGTRNQLQQPLATMLLILVALSRDDVCKGDQ